MTFTGARLSIVPAVITAVTLQGCGQSVPRPAAAVGRTAPVTLEELSVDGLGRVLRDGSARATVVNVWATWCLPCREEFPDLLRFDTEFRGRGVRLLLVSADFTDRRAEVEEFLAQHGVSATTYLKTGPDMEFIEALSKDWSGSLPATFVFDGSGSLRSSFEGKVDFAWLSGEVEQVLSRDPEEGGER